jgi:hypothetical protein
MVGRAELSLLRLTSGPYGTLLCWLLGLNALAPAFSGGRKVGLLLDLIACGVLLAGVRAASPGRKSLGIVAILIVADLATHWPAVHVHSRATFVIHYGLTFLILGFTTCTILSSIVRNSQVTLETLKAAACVYLLVGLSWVYLFALVDLAIPGSFLVRESAEEHSYGHLVVSESFPTLLYFSYSTLTTLGFGDILPLSGPARTLSYLEAIVGQIYLTMLIARLVGMHITQSANDGSQRL